MHAICIADRAAGLRVRYAAAMRPGPAPTTPPRTLVLQWVALSKRRTPFPTTSHPASMSMVKGFVPGGPRYNIEAKKEDGKFARNASKHRSGVGSGSAGLTSMPQSVSVEAEEGRYHLHVSLACPWAAGTYSMLKLKGLDDVVSVSIVHPTWQRTKPDDADDEHCGWVYRKLGDPPLSNPLGHGSNICDGALVPDSTTNCASIREVYELCGDINGPFSTPLLWDKKTKTIVSNESMDILYILNFGFDTLARNPEVNLYPPKGSKLEAQLQALNDKVIYGGINNGAHSIQL